LNFGGGPIEVDIIDRINHVFVIDLPAQGVTQHRFRVLIEELNLSLKLLNIPQVIGIQDSNKVATRHLKRLLLSAVCAKVFFVLVNLDTRVRVAPRNGNAIIFTTIVEKDQLPIGKRLTDHAIKASPQEPSVVVARNDY
jgi:hypothetical protein